MNRDGSRKRSARSRSLVGKPGTSAGDVRAYLERHPNFLEDNPELLEILTPPELHSGRAVSDFQRFQVERLQQILSELGHHQDHLIARTRSNLTNQKMIHQAALAVLDAEDLSELVHRVTRDWPVTLGVDAAAIGIELDGPRREALGIGDITALTPGWIDRLLDDRDAVILRGPDVTAARMLFGPAAPLINAQAMVRLQPGEGTPLGLLAFGTRDEDGFYPGQGTELLRFLGAILERCLNLWLEQSN